MGWSGQSLWLPTKNQAAWPIGEVASSHIYLTAVTGLTAYSEAEGAVRASLTVSIDVKMNRFAILQYCMVA